MRRTIRCAFTLLACALPAWADLRISPSDGASHAYPRVCRGSSDFVAVWESGDASGSRITVQRLQGPGNPLLSPVQANQGDSVAQLPDVACRGNGSFLVVWESRQPGGNGSRIRGRNFGASGAATDSEFAVNNRTDGDQRGPRACASGSGRTVVVWSSTAPDGEGEGVFGQRFGTDWEPSGGVFQINTTADGNHDDAAIACIAGGIQLIVWRHRPADKSAADIRARLYDEVGEALGDEFAISPPGDESREHPAVAAAPDGGFAVAYETLQTEQAGRITVRRVGSEGSLGGEMLLDLEGRGRHEAPVLAFSETGNLFAAWSRGSGFDYDIAGARLRVGAEAPQVFSVNRLPEGNDGALSTLGGGLDIASDGFGGDLAVWQKREVFEADSTSSIYAQRFEQCSGDCSDDGLVRINELILAVGIALGNAELELCPSVDRDQSGAVEINELIRAVNEALAGICPAPVG